MIYFYLNGGCKMDEINNKNIDEVIKSGMYPVVNLKIFDTIDNIKLNSKVLDEYKYARDEYFNYIELICKENIQFQKGFLDILKNADIIDNQSMEQEDSFLLSLYRTFYSNDESAIDHILNNKDNKLTAEFLKNAHHLLLKGTSSYKKEIPGFRTGNTKYVGCYRNGIKDIKYFPILAEEVDEASTILCDKYNYEITDKFDEFSAPFILHGLIAALQMFDDGNTRFARLIQHTEIHNLTNLREKYNLDLPALYATRNYFADREKYRRLITDLVVKSDNEAWNDWLLYNFQTIINQIDVNVVKVRKYKMEKGSGRFET